MRCLVTDEDESALKELAARIEASRLEIHQAEKRRDQVAAKANELERKLAIQFQSFDPLDDAAVLEYAQSRARLQVIREWIANAYEIQQAVAKLMRDLQSAEPLLRASAQPRSREEGAIAPCYWKERLVGLWDKPLLNQLSVVRDVVPEVLRDIGVLLQAKRGVLLTNEEIRAGVLRDGLTVLRQLTPQERQQRWAVA